MPQLRVNKVKRVGKVSVKDGKVTTIGRSSDNEVVLTDQTVSRRHCNIEIIDGASRIRDLGSRYGTRVNGDKVKEQTLTDGDLIQDGTELGEFTGHATDTDAFVFVPDADSGATEVTLLGQTVNSYKADGVSFTDLLRSVARVPGIRRVRNA